MATTDSTTINNFQDRNLQSKTDKEVDISLVPFRRCFVQNKILPKVLAV